jgi:hypothetical protein
LAEAMQVEPPCDLQFNDLELCRRYSAMLKKI